MHQKEGILRAQLERMRTHAWFTAQEEKRRRQAQHAKHRKGSSSIKINGGGGPGDSFRGGNTQQFLGLSLNNEYIFEDPDEFMQKMKRDPQGSSSKKKAAEKINEKVESENEYSWDPDFD